MVYLLRYDSVHGNLKDTITADEKNLIVNGHASRVYTEKEPTNIPWTDCDIILECTGVFTTIEKA